jgi:DNA-binding response OmpR family regulator
MSRGVAARNQERSGTMGAKVLVVDDEWQIRALLTDLLTAKGHEVYAVASGEEALAQAAEIEPQVILLDIKMPGMDGIELCKQLRAREQTSRVPIIMLTAYDDRNIDAYLEGADDFVKKPFDPVELVFRIRAVLRISHLTDELKRTAAHVKALQKEIGDA